jgi:hypothetical protein
MLDIELQELDSPKVLTKSYQVSIVVWDRLEIQKPMSQQITTCS